MIRELDDAPLRYVLERLRPEDVYELKATQDYDPSAIVAMLSAARRIGWSFHLPDGEPVSIFGGYVPHKGVGSAFLFSTAKIRELGPGLPRAVRSVVPPIMDVLGLHRLETMTMADRHEARRWLEFLGAELESTRAAYGMHGEDFVVYRWLKKP